MVKNGQYFVLAQKQDPGATPGQYVHFDTLSFKYLKLLTLFI